MTKELDSKDWKILYNLCTDSRLSHNKIAKLVGLSKNSVTYRIERLVKKGIISGFFTIINQESLGFETYNLFLRLNASKEKEEEIISYFKNHPNTKVVDRLLGEWNLLVNFGCREFSEFYSFMKEVKTRFSGIIDVYEVHQRLESYKVEQLPVELVGEPTIIKPFKKITKKAEVDLTDLRLLRLLDQDSTSTLFELGEKLGITYETVSERIKKLKEAGIIIKFTAKISLGTLGYDVYLILTELRNLSGEREDALRNYINSQKNIRYSFISASKPILFLYLAAKNSGELNNFLLNMKQNFPDIIVNQKYLLSTEQIKYELFPEGFVGIKEKQPEINNPEKPI